MDPEVVSLLREVVEEYNPHAQTYRMAAERFKIEQDQNVRLVLYGKRPRDGRQYNLPTCNEVAALLVGMFF